MTVEQNVSGGQNCLWSQHRRGVVGDECFEGRQCFGVALAIGGHGFEELGFHRRFGLTQLLNATDVVTVGIHCLGAEQVAVGVSVVDLS